MADALVQIGEIQSIDPVAGTVTVYHADAGINGSTSTDLPIMRPKRPEIGDPVAVIFLSNGAAYGICIGSFYQEETPPPDNGNIIEIFALPNGDSIEYDVTTRTLLFNVPNIQMAGGGPAVARVGDTVQCGPYSGTITGGSSKVSSG